MKISRPVAFSIILAINSMVFVVGSFAANLMTGPLGWSWAAYVLTALGVGSAYGCLRWMLAKPERLRLIASESLANSLADAAESYGVDKIYNMQRRDDQDRRNSDTQLSIDRAQMMRLAANSGASYLSVGVNRHWQNVRERLAERVPFRVVLLDPMSRERKTRNAINVVGEAEDNKLPLGDIIRACNQYPELDVRFVSTGMTCTVFITETEAYFDPYHLAHDGGRISNLFLCLRMRKVTPTSGLSDYEIVSRHFDSLWRIARPLPDWLNEYETAIGPLPKLKPYDIAAGS